MKGKYNIPYHPENTHPFTGEVCAKTIKAIFSNCYDFELRPLMLGAGVIKCSICFIDGLTSGGDISEKIIKPATSDARFGGELTEEDAVTLMENGIVYGYTAKVRRDINDVVSDLLNGYCAIIFDSIATAVTFETRTADKRSISEPKEEKSIKGGKDVFIEIIKTNTMLVRRRIQDGHLKFKDLSVGRHTKTTVTVVYIDGFTNDKLVNEMTRRLKRIDVEGVLSAGSIEQYISDRPKNIFPQLLRTERPDRFCTNLLEGRVGILIDGLPMGYLAPASFAQFMKMPEDNAYHPVVASILTLLRYFAMVLALLLPAIYVAIVVFHQEMLPTRLMQTIIDSKQSVPLPTTLETLSMLAAFELLQEAGLRLPDPVGQTVSIIGALIVGQSAVEAKVVSPVVVIVVALSGIAGYTVPNQDMSAAVRIWRFIFVVAASLGGFFTVMAAVCVMVYSLCDLTSFGADYMAPFSTGDWGLILRSVLKLPLRREKIRWPDTGAKNKRARR